MTGNAFIITMDVCDSAIKLEKDGEAYEAYCRDAAAASSHKGLGTILTMLADIEVEHYHIFERVFRHLGGTGTTVAVRIMATLRETGRVWGAWLIST